LSKCPDLTPWFFFFGFFYSIDNLMASFQFSVNFKTCGFGSGASRFLFGCFDLLGIIS
jgi:hypothetical protein